MKIYAIVNEVELGVSLNPEEVMDLGAAFAEIFSSSESTNSFMKSVNDIVNAAANAAKPAEDEPEDEESEEPEEATDEEDECEELVKRLKETGAEVLKFGDDDMIECHTFCDTTSNKEKYALVRAWLKSKAIKYKIETNGIKKYVYHLSPIQLIELQRYLKDNDIVSYDVNV